MRHRSQIAARACDLVVTAAALAPAACTFAPPLMPAPSVEAFAASYAEAFASGDPERVVEHLTEDFVAMAPEAEAIVGKAAVADQIRADFAQLRVRELQFVPLESHVGDGWAWVRGYSSGSLVRSGVRHLLPLEGKFLWILRLDEGGRWRLARDASSASRPHTHAGAPPAR